MLEVPGSNPGAPTFEPKEEWDGADVIVLGANVARQCLEAGLLDEIIIHVALVLVGGGVRSFDRTDGGPVSLEPISSVVEGETTVLRYYVR